MRAAGRPARPVLGRDDAGSFLVLEAILVALLVLTAIIFFTNVQRPSTGAGEGGLDLGQVASDTLSILQLRTFTVSGSPQTFNGWITNATRGDNATITTVDTFLKQVLPTGAHYSLRLDNGVGALQILPASTTEVPRNARAAEVATTPPWFAFRNASVSGATMKVVHPGDVLAPSSALYPLVTTGTYQCYEAPNGYTTTPSGAQWRTRWQSALQAEAPTTNGKDVASTLGANQQVPRDLPLGKWKLSTAAAVSGHCGSTGLAYLDVVPPGSRSINVTTQLGNATVNAASTTARFSNADVGLAVSGTGIPAGTRIASVTSSSRVTLSAVATAAATTTITLPPDPTFMPYGVQLVVWFGA